MGPIWDAELRVWDAKNFGLVSPGTHRNKFVKKSLFNMLITVKMPTFVGILTYLSMIDFILCSAEHENFQGQGRIAL